MCRSGCILTEQLLTGSGGERAREERLASCGQTGQKRHLAKDHRRNTGGIKEIQDTLCIILANRLQPSYIAHLRF